jgi:hypothetical protein
MALAPGAVIRLICCGGRQRTLLRTIMRAILGAILSTILGTVLMAMAVAIMTRPALVRSAAGPPHINHFRRRDSMGRSRCGHACIRRSRIADGSRLNGRFAGSLLLRCFTCLSFR